MKGNVYKLPYFIAEALIYLIRENSERTTTEIFRYVKERLSGKELLSKSDESNKKTLLKALRFLSEAGLIEEIEGSGRQPTRWKISERVFKERNFYLNEEEITSFLIFFSFIPEEYRNLFFFEPVVRVAERLSQEIDPEKLKIIKKAFFYEPRFTMRFAEVDRELLKKATKSVLNTEPLSVVKDGQIRNLWPVNLFFFNGNLYLGALKPVKEGKRWKFPFRSYLLHSLKLSPSEPAGIPKPSQQEIEEARRNRIGFSEENEVPFIFGVELSPFAAREIKRGGKVFTTQFFSIPKENTVYLVGFTHPSFYNDFLSKEFVRVIPPNEEIKRVAKKEDVKKFLKKNYSHLNADKFSYNLKENLKRFEEFKRGVLEILSQKRDAFKQ